MPHRPEQISPSEPGWQIRILFDADCPLCAREGRLLMRLDDGRGQIDLEDISAPGFDPSVYGLDLATLEARIHGVLPDGSLVEGVEVFTRAYEAVGLGWLMRPAKWPGFRWILDRLYLIFARNRLRLTGRAPRVCAPSEDGQAEGCRIQADDAARIKSGIAAKSG